MNLLASSRRSLNLTIYPPHPPRIAAFYCVFLSDPIFTKLCEILLRQKVAKYSQWVRHGANWHQRPSLNGAGDLKEKHVVLYLEKTERGRMEKKYFCRKRKTGAKMWKMSEMRGAAVSPLGWQNFTARKCRRRRQRNTTPREKLWIRREQLFRQISPKYWNFPKFASALFEFSRDLPLSIY